MQSNFTGVLQFHILDLITNVSFSQIDKSASGLYSLAVVNSTGELWHYFKITIEGEQLLGATLLEIMRYVDIGSVEIKYLHRFCFNFQTS